MTMRMSNTLALTDHCLGAFGAHPDHDAHILSTLSAIQILAIQDAMDRLDVPRIVKCKLLVLFSSIWRLIISSHIIFAAAVRRVCWGLIWRN